MKGKKLPLPQGGVNSTRRRRVLPAAALLVLALAGCAWRPATSVRRVPPGEWPATLGGATRAPFAAETAPEAPRELWRRSLERGIESAPIVHGELLLFGTTGRAVVTASARTGARYWVRRLGGPVVGSSLRVGEQVISATASRDGRVQAMSVARGRKLWETRLRSPVAADPLFEGGRVYAATLRSELHALDAGNGEVVWRVRTPGPVRAAPAVHGRSLLLATARDTLLRLALADGRTEAAAALPGTPSAPLALAGDRLYVPLHPGVVASYDARTLALLRLDTVGAPVLAAPVVDADGTVYVLTRDAELWRLGASDAVRIAALGGAAGESLTLARNGLLAGRLDGTLFLLRRDGAELWRQQYGSSLRAPVTLAGGALYVGLENGLVVKLQ